MSECKKCNYKFTDHTNINNDQKPEPGDYTVCIDCGTIGTFDSKFNLQPLSIAAWSSLEMADPKIWRQLMQYSELIRKTRPTWKNLQSRRN